MTKPVEPATPLPWYISYTTTQKGLQLPVAIESESEIVAIASDVYDNGNVNYIDINDEDAAYIVEACNEYPKLKAENERLRGLLLTVQWDGEGMCPLCYGSMYKGGGHRPTCELAAALNPTD